MMSVNEELWSDSGSYLSDFSEYDTFSHAGSDFDGSFSEFEEPFGSGGLGWKSGTDGGKDVVFPAEKTETASISSQQKYVTISSGKLHNPNKAVENNIVIETSQACASSSRLTERKGGIPITLEELEEVYGLKRKDAAEKLNVSVSTFKRICREYKISRWPPRKRNADNQSPSSSTSQNAYKNKTLDTVTIKAKYGDDIIRFRLPAASGINALNEQVFKRLKLEVGTYKVKYLDDDYEWISIFCDEDLQDYISSSRSSDKTSMTVLLEPLTK